MKVLIAIRMPGTDPHQVIQAHRRYLVQLMQQWTRIKDDEADDAMGLALAIDAELLRLDSVVRWLDLADARIERAGEPRRARTRTSAGAAAAAPAGIEGTPMSAAVRERPAIRRASNGGIPARRAVIRWALRLLRREWRQQLLILALITVAVAATVVGPAVATATPSPATAAFGTAQDLATFTGPGPAVAAQIASISRRFGTVDVIENQTLSVPGSIQTYSLRAQNPHGAFGSRCCP